MQGSIENFFIVNKRKSWIGRRKRSHTYTEGGTNKMLMKWNTNIASELCNSSAWRGEGINRWINHVCEHTSLVEHSEDEGEHRFNVFFFAWVCLHYCFFLSGSHALFWLWYLERFEEFHSWQRRCLTIHSFIILKRLFWFSKQSDRFWTPSKMSRLLKIVENSSRHVRYEHRQCHQW